MINGLVHIADQLFLSIPIVEGKLQLSNGLLPQFSPLPGIVRPFAVITDQLLEPGFQSDELIIFIKIADIFRLYIAIGQPHPDIGQLLLQAVHIGVAFRLGNM